MSASALCRIANCVAISSMTAASLRSCSVRQRCSCLSRSFSITFRARAAYSRTAEVGVYVHHDFHRRGIGRALIDDVVARGHDVGLHAIVGGCCSESVASIGLLESCGFRRVAHFREVGFKFERWLDVIFLERLLS